MTAAADRCCSIMKPMPGTALVFLFSSWSTTPQTSWRSCGTKLVSESRRAPSLGLLVSRSNTRPRAAGSMSDNFSECYVGSGSTRRCLTFDCGVHAASKEERQSEIEAIRVLAANIVEGRKIVLEQDTYVGYVESDISRGSGRDPA